MDGCGRRDRPVGFPVLLYWSLSWGRRAGAGASAQGTRASSRLVSRPSLGLLRLRPPVPAMITSHPNTTIAIKGHAKELNCTARGERPIIIRWEKGDTVIDPDRVMRYAIATKDNGDEVVSTLKVSTPTSVLGGPQLSESGEPAAITSASRRQMGSLGAPPHTPKMYLPFPTYFPSPSRNLCLRTSLYLLSDNPTAIKCGFLSPTFFSGTPRAPFSLLGPLRPSLSPGSLSPSHSPGPPSPSPSYSPGTPSAPPTPLGLLSPSLPLVSPSPSLYEALHTSIFGSPWEEKPLTKPLWVPLPEQEGLAESPGVTPSADQL